MSFEPLTIYLALEVGALQERMQMLEEDKAMALKSYHAAEEECQELSAALTLADEARDMLRGQAILLNARVNAYRLKTMELKDKVACANIKAMVAERDLKERNLQLEEMSHKYNMERLRNEEMVRPHQHWMQKKKKVFVWKMPKVEKMD